MKRHRRGALVRVTWVDSESLEGWQDSDTLEHKSMRCTTVGYVVAHRKDRLMLTSSWHGRRRHPPEVMAPITIPVVAIRRVEVLEA